MVHAPLLVEGCHRLGPKPLGPPGMQRLERHHGIDLPHHRLDQRAALVHLGNHALGPVPDHRGAGGPGPVERRGRLDRRILDHIGAPVLRRTLHHRPRHHDAAGVRGGVAAHRRVDRDDDPVEIGRAVGQAGREHFGGPERAFGIGQQHAFELLAPLPRAGVAALHLVEEPAREIGGVGLRGRVGDHRAVGGQQVAQHRRVARRRRHAGARIAQAQPELQHVPRLGPALPLGQLVGPCRVELRAAQRLVIMRREDLRHGAVGPCQHPPGRAPDRSAVGRRTGHDAAFAEHHDLARLIERLAHQGHAPRPARVAGARAFDLRAHPFGPGAGLARAAPAEDHPCAPVALGRELMRQRPEVEEPWQRRQLRRVQTIEELSPRGSRRAGDPAGNRSAAGRRRCRSLRPRDRHPVA